MLAAIATFSGAALDKDWNRDAGSSATFLTLVSRKGLVGGENTWTIQAPAGSTDVWLWWAAELANLATVGPLTKAESHTATSVTPLSTGNSGTINPDFAPYVLGIAAFSISTNGAGTRPGFPTISGYSLGWQALGQWDSGTGVAIGDTRLAVAVYYGAYRESGPFSCQVDLTGTLGTGYSTSAHLAVHRSMSYMGDV